MRGGARNVQVPAFPAVDALAAVRCAVGFSTTDIKQLLALWQDRRRPAREIKRLAQRHLVEIEARVRELEAIAETLAHLIGHCHGDDRPDCPILEALTDDRSTGSGAPKSGEAGSRREAPRRPPRQAPRR
jgi:hypothetical protein